MSRMGLKPPVIDQVKVEGGDQWSLWSALKSESLEILKSESLKILKSESIKILEHGDAEQGSGGLN